MSIYSSPRRIDNVIRKSLAQYQYIRLFHCSSSSSKAAKYYLVDKQLPHKKYRAYLDSNTTRHRLVQYGLPARIFRHIVNLALKMTENPAEEPTIRIPSSVKGMKKLNREAFLTTVQVPSILIPVKSVAVIMKKMKDLAVLKRPGIRPLVDLPESDPDGKTFKRLLIHPDKYSEPSDLPENIVKLLQSCDVDLKWSYVDLKFDYSNWSFQEIFKVLLPDDSEGVSGFSQIGHIVHLNLKEDLLEYKTLIGEVLLDKVVKAKTIVNKIDTIGNEYRNFQLELLAGEEDYVAQVKENGFTFEMDFSKVYWNTRLGQEHHRIVSLVKNGDTVFDVFAGVGPFAVPAAKKKCTVFANDLNPESYKWLCSNAKLNKAQETLTAYNLDGRDFIRNVVKPNLIKLCKENNKGDIHIIMNLPAIAIEFLDTFHSLLPEDSCSDKADELNCKVYCYCFRRTDVSDEELHKKAEEILKCTVPDYELRYVRKVAPNKDMFCFIFPLTKAILCANCHDEPSAKKMKI